MKNNVGERQRSVLTLRSIEGRRPFTAPARSARRRIRHDNCPADLARLEFALVLVLVLVLVLEFVLVLVLEFVLVLALVLEFVLADSERAEISA